MLVQAARRASAWPNIWQPKILQTLYYTNKVQAAKKLDRFLKELDALDK